MDSRISPLASVYTMPSKVQRIAGEIRGDIRPGEDRIDEARDDTGMKGLMFINDLEHHAWIHV